MAKKPQNVTRDMAKDLAAAAALKEQLKTAFGLNVEDETSNDLAVLRDTVEGETALFDTIDAVLIQIANDMAQQDALKELEARFKARRERFERREELLRTMLANALDTLGEKKMERPAATFTLKLTPPKVIVTDEAQIPAQYFKQPDPVLNRAALGDALKARDAALAEIQAAEALINADEESGACDEGTIAARRTEIRSRVQSVIADMPPIPGAELSNGGATVQVRFS